LLDVPFAGPVTIGGGTTTVVEMVVAYAGVNVKDPDAGEDATTVVVVVGEADGEVVALAVALAVGITRVTPASAHSVSAAARASGHGVSLVFMTLRKADWLAHAYFAGHLASSPARSRAPRMR
jgi:hypothetical protein